MLDRRAGMLRICERSFFKGVGLFLDDSRAFRETVGALHFSPFNLHQCWGKNS